MKVEIRNVTSTRKEMEVFIPKEDVQKFSDEIYHEIATGMAVKGFRKGRAPRHILKMYYGDYIKGELTKKLVNENFEKAAKEKEIFVVSIPEVENDEPKEGEDFKFVAKFDVKPEVKPEKYTGLELKRIKYDVRDEDVDLVLVRLRESYANIADVDAPDYEAAKGDYVIIDVKSDEYPKMNRDKMTVEAGSRSFIPGLQDAVIGMKAQEEKDVEVAFPQDHFMEEMRGKTARPKIFVHAIKQRILPELDDEFAKKVREDVDGIEALRKVVKDELLIRAEERSRNMIERDIVEKLIDANKFDIPESMVKLQAALMIQGMAHRFSAQGIRLQDVYPDPSELKQETIASSERTLRQTLLIEAVAKLSGIEASEEDLEREIEAMAKRYNLAMETVRKGLEEKNKIEEVKFTALEKKVFDHIIANSHVTEEIERMEEASV